MAEGAAAPGFVLFGLADGLAGPALETGDGLQDLQDVAELVEGGLRQELLHLLPELFLQAAGVLLSVQGAGDGGLPLLADDRRDVVPHQLVAGPLVHGDGASSFLLIIGAGESPQAKAMHWARNWSRRWGKAWLPHFQGASLSRRGCLSETSRATVHSIS